MNKSSSFSSSRSNSISIESFDSSSSLSSLDCKSLTPSPILEKKDEKKKVIPFRRVREKPRISDSPPIANVVSKFPYLLKKINNFFDISGNKIDNK